MLNVEDVLAETHSTTKRIDETFGNLGYEPVVLIGRPLSFYEIIAFYIIAECVVVTIVMDYSYQQTNS